MAKIKSKRPVSSTTTQDNNQPGQLVPLFQISPKICRNDVELEEQHDPDIEIREKIVQILSPDTTQTKKSNVKKNKNSMVKTNNNKVKKSITTSTSTTTSTITKTKTTSEISKPKKLKSTKKLKVTRTARADLTFPVSRVERMIREGGYTKRCSSEAPVFLTAVLEYLTLEILELSVTYSNQKNKNRITPQHIHLSICSDSELNDLFKNVTIANGGVPNYIHPILLGSMNNRSPQQKTNIIKEKEIKKEILK
ncbi:hypothetical protein ACTFIU_003774 [Dictyostelium citrinum]